MNEKERNIQLYHKIYLMRRAEEKIQEVYFSDIMKTPVHLSLGEESIVAGVCQALTKSDQVYGTCRGHALYLARTEDLDAYYGELCGKVTGVAKGKAGSMHISYPEMGFIASSAIVSSIIPVALGGAFAIKYQNKSAIAVVFLGDGATEEGVFWESLNMAAIKQLPILFVCEDNGLAIHAHKRDRQGYSISDAAKQFGISVYSDDSNDADRIYAITTKAIQEMKQTGTPQLLHFKYHRYLEHVGVCEDYAAGYRGDRQDYAEWYKKDPVALQRAKLFKIGVLEEECLEIEESINHLIENSLKRAIEAPLPGREELFKDVYA